LERTVLKEEWLGLDLRHRNLVFVGSFLTFLPTLLALGLTGALSRRHSWVAGVFGNLLSLGSSDRVVSIHKVRREVVFRFSGSDSTHFDQTVLTSGLSSSNNI